MVEWSITTVLKTVVPRGTGGSNPSLSAINPEKTGISRNLYTKMYTKRLNFNKSRRFLFKSKKFSKL